MPEDRKQIAIFKGKQIRRVWDDAQEKWFFSVVDIIAALSESKNPAVYWRKDSYIKQIGKTI